MLPFPLPQVRVQVIEAGRSARPGWKACAIGSQVKFSTEALESYCFAQWEPVVFDMLLLAGVVEYCDKIQPRPARSWGRDIEVEMPVHDPARWNASVVLESLQESLEFLTGDRWRLIFVGRKHKETAIRQGRFAFGHEVLAVIPYSDGLDSRAVAGLLGDKLGDGLIRVRLGSKSFDPANRRAHRLPFASVPYHVAAGGGKLESSGRSRGFKFALIAGLAAYLASARRVIVPESGQGAIGPVLVPVGQAYPDYRNHPLFLNKMASFIRALLMHNVGYEAPQLWHTKGETLKEFVSLRGVKRSWSDTWSCWQQSRQSSVDGRKRQCGICAACLLRRMSIHATGLGEPKETYVWESLTSKAFADGAASGFGKNKITDAMREYAIAGTLHLDHLAGLTASPAHVTPLRSNASQLARALGLAEEDVLSKLTRLLKQHEREWKDFVGSLGPDSFLLDWARSVS